MINIKNFKVSAVIPTFNSQNFIYNTLESLTNQTVELTEIIVVDDASTDQTRQIIEKFIMESKLNIKTLYLDENQGVSNARNIGINMSTSDWIMLLDSDDTIEPNLLEEYEKSLQTSIDVSSDQWVLVHSASRQINVDGDFLGGIQRFKQVMPKEIQGYEFIRNHVFVSGTIFLKDAYKKAGGFDNKLKYSEDWDLWLRMAGVGGFLYVDKPLVNVRRHGDNASSSINKMFEGELKVLQKYTKETIRKAIHKRELPYEQNEADFISILYRLGEWNLGFLKIEEIIKINNNCSPLLFLRGLYYINKREVDLAIEDFTKVLALEPNDGASRNNLGALLALNGRQEECIKMLESVVALYPNYNDAKQNLEYAKNDGELEFHKVKFTWRRLRDQLTEYIN